MSRKALATILSMVVFLAAAAALMLSRNRPTLHGSVIKPPLAAPGISLVDFDGAPFSLDSARGKVVILYFGYTNCPDECPLAMAHMKLVAEELGAKADRLRVVMVTTDPARDTPEALKSFLGKFDSAFIGLTGTPEALQGVWKDYGVTVLDGGETHSNYLYVIDASGNLVETLLADADVATIASDSRILLR